MPSEDAPGTLIHVDHGSRETWHRSVEFDGYTHVTACGQEFDCDRIDDLRMDIGEWADLDASNCCDECGGSVRYLEPAITDGGEQHGDGVDWPAGYDRTDPDDRVPYPGNISVGHREAFKSIDEELSRWGAGLKRVEFAAPEYVNDSRIPHKSVDPEDPGVVVYFRRVDEHADQGYAIACDRWDSLRDNARAIALYVRRKRLAERCGVATAEEEFQTTALPPGDGSKDVVVAEPVDDREPHEVLGISPDAPDPVVRGAFRELVKEAHADQGANGEYDVSELKQARDALLEGSRD